VGFVPYAEVEKQFDAARILVNTSEFEGFPNTFLQAWVRHMPTVSFVDTGSRVANQSVVSVARDLDEMSKIVATLMTDDEVWNEAGSRSRICVNATHTPEIAVKAYERIFESFSLDVNCARTVRVN
jgi:glycosyltransferase involved in cell wall biosynthesis